MVPNRALHLPTPFCDTDSIRYWPNLYLVSDTEGLKKRWSSKPSERREAYIIFATCTTEAEKNYRKLCAMQLLDNSSTRRVLRHPV